MFLDVMDVWDVCDFQLLHSHARVVFEICFCYDGADRIEVTKCEKGGIEGKPEKSRQPIQNVSLNVSKRAIALWFSPLWHDSPTICEPSLQHKAHSFDSFACVARSPVLRE